MHVVSVLRHFREVIGHAIYAWDAFLGSAAQCLKHNDEVVNQRWREYLHNAQAAVLEMQFLDRQLSRKIELFDSMKDDVRERPLVSRRVKC